MFLVLNELLGFGDSSEGENLAGETEEFAQFLRETANLLLASRASKEGRNDRKHSIS